MPWEANKDQMRPHYLSSPNVVICHRFHQPVILNVVAPWTAAAP